MFAMAAAVLMPDAPSTRSDFAGFYRATIAPLRRYLARMMGNQTEAQDLAHDAYAKVLPALREKTVGQPQAFLYTTARHLALDRLKRRARAPFHPSQTADDATALSSSPGVEAIVMAREEWTLMERAVAELPPGCRQVLLLRTIDRLSHAEIAARLGLARSSVEKHLLRATRLLHASINENASGKNADVLPLRGRTGTGGA